MSDDFDQWAQFADLGVAEVRRRLGGRIYGDAREKLAREWLALQESLRMSADNAASLAEARAANELARSANDLAERANASALEANSIASIAAASAALSVSKARTNNVIASAALAAAIIAIVVSIIGLRHTDGHGNAQKAQTENTQAH
jgi:ferric-dicitrate binding protein FerR (iron transport regulator)